MKPAHTTGRGRSVLYYGSLDVPCVLELFWELRDPLSARMALPLLDAITGAADRGELVAQFHFAANIDLEYGGDGSRRALSALGAAADTGADAFTELLEALFSCQPRCFATDAFRDASFLLDVASRVPALRSDVFDRKVLEDTYADWAQDSVSAFQLSRPGSLGTPTLWVDQRLIWFDNLAVLGLPRSPLPTSAQLLAALS